MKKPQFSLGQKLLLVSFLFDLFGSRNWTFRSTLVRENAFYFIRTLLSFNRFAPLPLVEILFPSVVIVKT
jgi:hypothetical protein